MPDLKGKRQKNPQHLTRFPLFSSWAWDGFGSRFWNFSATPSPGVGRNPSGKVPETFGMFLKIVFIDFPSSARPSDKLTTRLGGEIWVRRGSQRCCRQIRIHTPGCSLLGMERIWVPILERQRHPIAWRWSEPLRKVTGNV